MDLGIRVPEVYWLLWGPWQGWINEHMAVGYPLAHLARLISLDQHLEVAAAQPNITLQFSSRQALNPGPQLANYQYKGTNLDG